MLHDLFPRLRFPLFGPAGLGRRLAGVATACVVAVVAACGGGGGGDSSAGGGNDTPPSVVMPGYTAGTADVDVVMPAGSAVTADKVTVETSLGDVKASASGAASVPVYTGNGSQLALVLSPAGNTMMMGWVDATHSTISAQTTAHVLAYFALGGSRMLSSADAQALIAAIPAAPGIADVEAAVQNSLAADPDSLAAANDAVQTAVSSFATSLLQGAQAVPASTGRVKAQSMLIQPETQSGVTALQDPPSAAHLSNAYRRRAWAFVERVSHTTDGTEVADAASLTDFEVPPTAGVNGGVTGAINDIVNAYWGNQATAYAPVTAPASGTFAVTPVDGADKTTFKVTVVGPGAEPGVRDQLSTAQASMLRDVSISGFAKDFVGPTLCNIVLGSGALDGSPDIQTLNTGLVSDITGLVANAPATIDHLVAGDWFGVLTDITSGGTGTLHGLIVNALTRVAGARYDTTAVEAMTEHVSHVLGLAGGLMQIFDSSAYAHDMANSDQADAFQIVVTPPKVQLTPATTQMGRGGTQVLTASVQGVDDLSGASFHWTSTHAFGDLSEVAGGGRQHQTDYCSSSGQAVFTYENDAGDGATDTVTVEIFPGSNCDPSRGASYGKASATVTLKTQQVTEPGTIGLESNDESFQVVVHFADVPGATHYLVHGDAPPGGGDPYYYGSSLDLGYDPNNPTVAYLGPIDHGVFLTGCSCNFSNEPAFLARFAGWTFTVTAYFN